MQDPGYNLDYTQVTPCIDQECGDGYGVVLENWTTSAEGACELCPSGWTSPIGNTPCVNRNECVKMIPHVMVMENARIQLGRTLASVKMGILVNVALVSIIVLTPHVARWHTCSNTQTGAHCDCTNGLRVQYVKKVWMTVESQL